MENNFDSLRKSLDKEINALKELSKIGENTSSSKSEENMMKKQADSLKDFINNTNKKISEDVSKLYLSKPSVNEYKPLNAASKQVIQKVPAKEKNPMKKLEDKLPDLDLDTLKRLKKKESNVKVEKTRKANEYVAKANKYFSGYSSKLLESDSFDKLKKDLIKSNMPFLAKSYVSVILFTTFWALVVGVILTVFFSFFNLSALYPFVNLSSESFGIRIGKIIWMPFVFPLATFLLMYIYPSLERSSVQSRINHELPFATIHMSAISGADISPDKIFDIIVATKEYPNLEKEFNKIVNDMHVFGKDLISALRTASENCPSKKLAELYNGIATTITSGGNLSEFFDKRANSLLFDYRLEQEKETKSAETFMDIYISVVIAAPMILMLLLIMMKVSGIGISLSTTMITVIMVLGVTAINIGFLTLLNMKQKK